MKHRKKSEVRAAKAVGTVGKIAGYVITFAVILCITLFLTMKIICAREIARNTFITTVLETGQLKFLASLALPQDEIQKVVDANSMKNVEEKDVNEEMISFDASGTAVSVGGKNDIEVVEIPGLTYKATLMIVKDPSRVSLATIMNENGHWPQYGETLEKIAKDNSALAAINGGLYSSTNNSGGYPFGVVVSKGKIVRNIPNEWPGLVLVGLTDKNILQIIDVSKMSSGKVADMIKEKGIRDAVCFQEEKSSDNNHFVQLIINGTNREVTGAGSGLNPRTAIGQRADGALLLLVTDGRGSKGHAGASAHDLIDIMSRYGAVNAANLDGGSSTCMYYDGKYLQNSVTFYYDQTSWRLPFAFIVK